MLPPLTIPRLLAAQCRKSVEHQDWIRRLPDRVRELATRWALTVGDPIDSDDTSTAWVAPVTRGGSSFVLKIALPHMEGQHEIEGLRFWNGNPTVQLIDADEELGAMLIERCMPGMSLRDHPESEQDVVIAGLLRRLWREPAGFTPFRPLSEMTAFWAQESLSQAERWQDAALVRAGLQLFDELPRTASRHVVLATDLHAGNVLRAQRKPWLVIDPKPFVGDPAYDATQHLFNCMDRLSADPMTTIEALADLLDVDRERVRLWTFARAAAEPRDDWQDAGLLALARTLWLAP
jgi:streptomycin 6-kinase